MLKQPSTNVKMTNVAIIKYKINNRTFEIACYRNKALNWRNGVEQDLSQVLQTEEIYENASHGTLAKKADLNKFFSNKTKLEVIEIILERGELQISDKEREVTHENLLADIVKIIVQKCVHPTTKRRFTPETIKQAIKDVHFAIKNDQTAKKQALDCIKLLQQKYKIARGLMKIRLSFPEGMKNQVEKDLKQLEIIEYEHQENKNEIICRVYNIEPNKYRDLSQICKKSKSIIVEVMVNVIVNSDYKELQTQQFSALELIHPLNEEENTKQQQVKPLKKVQEKTIKCSTCGDFAVFPTAQDQRLHFKTQWHVQNVKRKSQNQPSLCEEDFKVAQFNQNYK